MESPSILGSAVSSTAASAASPRKRRTRAMKSTTSSSVKALPSESIGTAWRTLPKASTGAAPTRCGRAVGAHERGKARLDRRVALAQRVVVGVGDLGRVLRVVELVVVGDLAREPRELGLRLAPRSARRPACWTQSCLHGARDCLRGRREIQTLSADVRLPAVGAALGKPSGGLVGALETGTSLGMRGVGHVLGRGQTRRGLAAGVGSASASAAGPPGVSALRCC